MPTAYTTALPPAVFDNHIEGPMERSFFSEIIASIADARFAGQDGRYIFTRDYLTVKVIGRARSWDGGRMRACCCP